MPCCSLSPSKPSDCEILKASNILRSRVEPASGGAKTFSAVRCDTAAVAETEWRKPQLRSCSCEALGGSNKEVLAAQFNTILILVSIC